MIGQLGGQWAALFYFIGWRGLVFKTPMDIRSLARQHTALAKLLFYCVELADHFDLQIVG